MPPNVPVVSGERAIRVMERLGFVRVRQRGSHVVLRKQTSESELICVIPLHKELVVGTLRSILRQAKVTPEDFLEHL